MLNGCAELIYTYKLYSQHILAMKYFWQNEAITAGCVPSNCLLKPHTMASCWNDLMDIKGESLAERSQFSRCSSSSTNTAAQGSA